MRTEGFSFSKYIRYHEEQRDPIEGRNRTAKHRRQKAGQAHAKSVQSVPVRRNVTRSCRLAITQTGCARTCRVELMKRGMPTKRLHVMKPLRRRELNVQRTKHHHKPRSSVFKCPTIMQGSPPQPFASAAANARGRKAATTGRDARRYLPETAGMNMPR